MNVDYSDLVNSLKNEGEAIREHCSLCGCGCLPKCQPGQCYGKTLLDKAEDIRKRYAQPFLPRMDMDLQRI